MEDFFFRSRKVGSAIVGARCPKSGCPICLLMSFISYWKWISRWFKATLEDVRVPILPMDWKTRGYSQDLQSASCQVWKKKNYLLFWVLFCVWDVIFPFWVRIWWDTILVARLSSYHFLLHIEDLEWAVWQVRILRSVVAQIFLLPMGGGNMPSWLNIPWIPGQSYKNGWFTKTCLNQLRNRKGYLIKSHFWKSELSEGSLLFLFVQSQVFGNLRSH